MNKLFAAALMVPLALVSPVSAQKTLHTERDAIELMLLRQKSVLEELKIDKEGGKKIFEFTHKQHEKAQEVHKMPPAEQTAKWEAMTKENDEFLHKSITPEQHKRLKQIAMQVAGLLFVTAPKISKELNLTKEQMAEATKLQGEIYEKVHAVMSAESKEGRNMKLKAIREEGHEKLAKLLTDEQKTKWKEYVGEPFKGELLFEEREKGK